MKAGRGQPRHGEPPQPSLLGRPDRRRRVTEVVVCAGLDLGEHDEVRARKDQIDLTSLHSPVARHDLVASIDVPARRLVLAPASAGVSAQISSDQISGDQISGDRISGDQISGD